MKVALLSSYTLDHLPDITTQYLQRLGVRVDWYMAPFNQYRREIEDPASGAHAYSPDVIILAIDATTALEHKEDYFDTVSLACRRFPSATILAHNLAWIAPDAPRLMQCNHPLSKRRLVAAANIRLSDLVANYSNLRIFDLEGIVLANGLSQMTDNRMYYLAKMLFNIQGLNFIGDQLAVALATLAGRRKKCLILDLDNTLWGGIVGEDGVEHIELANDGAGKAFYDFQQVILQLAKSGIILAVCSKNDRALAMEAMEKHPYMLLRPGQFAALEINWDDKAKNIQSIARQLGLGLDSFVYLDDSPHERERIRQALPEVTVPDLPEDYSDYATFLAQLPYFETFSITSEDARRSETYIQERQRADVRQEFGSFEEYLQHLNTTLKVAKAIPFSIPRIAQLTQRTNQFNLTGRRYTEAHIRGFSEDPSYIVLGVFAEDRFGDAGLVGTAIVRLDKETAHLDTFLMSCRVLGRKIEETFLAEVLNMARKKGAKRMTAEYIPSSRNGMAKDFLPGNGFVLNRDIYECILDNPKPVPPGITVRYADE